MKKYLKCSIITHAGTFVENPLKLSEAYLISKMAQENRKITVVLGEMSIKDYNLNFGK